MKEKKIMLPSVEEAKHFVSRRQRNVTLILTYSITV